MIIKVKERQTFFDIALQYQGSMESIFDMVIRNNISISDIPENGMELEISPVIEDKKVVNYYKNNNIEPATASYKNVDNIPIMTIDGINCVTHNHDEMIVVNGED
ncbi:MAG: hypothetical protein LBQ22_01860 [Bacteroidales bacterium]|jgi:hypothetical protein|nr:hypothetical protein [Bacteroidales bacterium]